MRLLINASNLQGGGGVAVAASILDSLAKDTPQDITIDVLAGPAVSRQATALGVREDAFSGFHVTEQTRRLALNRDIPVRPSHYDIIFNVFGPTYNPALAMGSVMGFAQPWIAFPSNEAWALLTPLQRLALRAKYDVQAYFFRMADVLVVEQEAVRQGLKAQRRFSRTRIEVVPSAVDPVHYEVDRWQSVCLPPHGDNELRLGLVARNYPHKNIAILPEALRILADRYGVRARLFVTFTAEEWESAPDSLKRWAINVGEITLAQCPSFYREMDAVVFPTLLECYSALPIEVQAAGVPLYCSDLNVIKETVGDYPTYFDPTSPADIAEKIAGGAHHRAGRGVNTPAATPAHPQTADLRAKALLDICRQTFVRRAQQ